MKGTNFWRSWSPGEKSALVFTLLVLFISLLALLWFSGILPRSSDIPWDILTQLNDLDIPANQFLSGELNYTISAPSVFLTEQYMAPSGAPDFTGGIVFLVVALTGLTLVLASLPSMSRFLFFGGFVVFVILSAFSSPEQLDIPGLPARSFLMLATLCYGGAGYYFHYYRPGSIVPVRLIVFGLVSTSLFVVASGLTTSPFPAYAFLTHSLPLWLVPALLFFLISATEIPAGIVRLTTSRAIRPGGKPLLNFLLISVSWILILALAYIGNTKHANWGIVLIPVYLPAIAGALLGLSGFRLRCISTGGAIDFKSAGFWLYTGLFLITIAVTGMAVASDNDPLLEFLEDGVVNTQLGMGLVFLFYVLVNFQPLFRQKLEVHKVLYKPLNFGLLQTRVIGVGLVVALYSMQSFFPVRQSLAAYNNGLGDYYTRIQQIPLAVEYYKKSVDQEFQNHKGNYALANLTRQLGDKNAAVFFLRQATLKQPSPQAYIGLGNILAEDGLYFEAMFTLKEGSRKFPENAQLLNNLGLLFAQTSVTDSAYYFLKAAAERTRESIPATNILGLLSGIPDREILDSLVRSDNYENNLAWHANKILIFNRLSKSEPNTAIRKDALRADSLLDAAGFAYWVNLAYNRGSVDTTLGKTLRSIAGKNDIKGDELLLAGAHADFYGGSKVSAVETLLSLSGSSGQSSEYHKILGHWFLQTGLYEQAIEQFLNVNDAESVVGHAIAQSLSGNPVSGTIALEHLKEFGVDSLIISGLQQDIVDLKQNHAPVDLVRKTAREKNSEEAYLTALRFNPWNPEIVTDAANFFLKNDDSPSRAYQIVVDALRFNDRSPDLWKLSALLNLESGLTAQAEESMEKFRQFASETDYHEFLPHYQSILSLKQKERDEFK